MIEILFFAALTGYMIFRLWSVLGKRTGFEAPPPPKTLNKEVDNVIPLPTRASSKQLEKTSPLETNPSIAEGLKKMNLETRTRTKTIMKVLFV